MNTQIVSRYEYFDDLKDFGYDAWFDSLPSHWNVKKIAHVVKMQSGDTIESSQISPEGKYPVFGGNGLRGFTENFNLEERHVLVGRQGALCGNINYSTGRIWASEHAIVVYPLAEVDVSWLGETLRAMDLNQYNVSAAQPGLSVSNLTCLRLPYPPIEEQQKIANFLDHETAKIDTLIEKQQQLIKLLKEKRQAVISHAVTKGLNPDAPMKDSGVEWLGEVPVGWGVLQLRRAVRSIEQGRSPECESRTADIDEWGVMKSGCVNYGVFDQHSNKALPPNRAPFEEYEIFKGDVLMSRASGSVDLIGSVALVGYVRPRLLMSDKIFRLNIEAIIMAQYLTLVMGSNYVRSLITIAISGAEGMANNLGKESIKSFKIPIPSLDDQKSIVEYLENLLPQIDDLQLKAAEGIQLLLERRTALISAAVTGKIDVRNWQPPEPTSTPIMDA